VTNRSYSAESRALLSAKHGSLAATLSANGLLRIAGSASGTLVGLYLVSMQTMRRGNTGAGMAGRLGAVAFAAELLFSIPLGMLADAWKPQWVMVAGALLGAVAVQLFGLTQSSGIFYLSRLLEGISVAAITPPLLAWLAERTEGDLRARARGMSFFELSLFAGFALGGVAATQLWSHFHGSAFSLVAVGYLLAAVLLAIFAGEARIAPRRTALHGLRLALQDEQVRRLAPVWLCVNAVSGLWLGPTLAFLMTAPSAPNRAQLFDGLYAGDSRRFGWVLLAYALLFAAGVTGWSVALPRVGIHRAMLVSLATMLPVCLGFYLVNHAAGASSGYRWSIGIATALLILVETGFTPAALSWLAGSLHGGLGKGSAMGIYSVLLSVGAIVGSLMAGWLGRLLRFDGLLLGTVLLACAGLLQMTRIPRDATVGEGDRSI
jgi:MFS family permease